MVIQFRDPVEFTCMWRATLNPCTSPYVPWYLGASRIPGGYGWILPQVGFNNHFTAPAGDLSYRPGRAWWAFQDVQDLADASYASVILPIAKEREALEKKWAEEQAEFEAKAREAYRQNPATAIAMLTEYTNNQAVRAWKTWRKLFEELMR